MCSNLTIFTMPWCCPVAMMQPKLSLISSTKSSLKKIQISNKKQKGNHNFHSFKKWINWLHVWKWKILILIIRMDSPTKITIQLPMIWSSYAIMQWKTINLSKLWNVNNMRLRSLALVWKWKEMWNGQTQINY